VSAPTQPDMPVHCEALLREINAQLHRQLAHIDQALALAEMKIRALEERLRLERIAKYGKRSETLSDLQLELLDFEPGVTSEEVAAESGREPIKAPSEDKQEESADKTQNKSRPKHPGRQTLPSHLARVEQIVVCTAEECTCGQCGHQTEVIGHEEAEVLDVRPAEYFVTVLKREKRACRQCQENGVRTAAVPERITAKSLLSDRVIIDIVVGKYCESLPLYRQQAMLRRDAGVEIALSTLDDAVMRVGELLISITGAISATCSPVLIYRRMRRRLASRHTTSGGAIIRPTCGSMARLVKAWSSTSAWAGTAMGQSSSWANSKVCCKQMATRDTTKLAARG
jgi:transposase